MITGHHKPTSGLTSAGLRNLRETTAAPLTTQQRKSLPKSKFAIPSKAPESGSYPIDTPGRAANALARSSGKPEAAAVKRAVCAKYPDLPACKA